MVGVPGAVADLEGAFGDAVEIGSGAARDRMD